MECAKLVKIMLHYLIATMVVRTVPIYKQLDFI